MRATFQHAIMGGTFDHFHVGHESFLAAAFKNSGRVTIGITTPPLIRHKTLIQTIESYDTRQKSVEHFITTNRWSDRAQIIPLHSIYGNGLDQEDIDAIFVTDASHANAKIINEKRQEHGLSATTIINVPLLRGTDDEVVSSTRIRLGRIDRHGHAYLRVFDGCDALEVRSTHLKSAFKEPAGSIVSGVDVPAICAKKTLTISIGDIVTASLAAADFTPDMVIYDLQNKRRPITDKAILQHLPQKPHVTLSNPPSMIMSGVARALAAQYDEVVQHGKARAIRVEGEEDLLVTPAVLTAPLGSIILYGLPDKGIVAVEVTEQKKHDILHDFALKMSRK